MILFSRLKNELYNLKKKALLLIKYQLRQVNRLFFVKDVITQQNCFKVPIIINNRNRVTFLRMMIDKLRALGYQNIYILDNNSTYPPLLEYYKTVNAKVVFLEGNVGYRALWKSDIFNRFKKGYYVYSDPDILLSDECPNDFVYQLYVTLNKFPLKEKAGVALKIDDLPDYRQKPEVLRWETNYWKKALLPDVYDAPVDTTLALYKPLAFGNAEECESIRVAGKLTAKHLPWYNNPENLSEEELYYKNHASSSSYWANK